MSQFKCVHCDLPFGTLCETVDHNIITHPTEEHRVKRYRRRGDYNGWQITNFPGVVPQIKKNMDRFILTDEASQSVKVSRLTTALSSPCSPMAKKARLTSTPVKKCLFAFDQSEMDSNGVDSAYGCKVDDYQDDDIKINDIDNDNIGNLSTGILNMSIAEVPEDTAMEIEEMNDLVPKVLETLKTEGQVETYIAFNRLVAEKSFPMSNIAYLLFLDIVNWFSTKTTTQMRYSDEVKRFWRVGLKLFKGKFLRFMSGMKNSGQQDIDVTSQNTYKASESLVNFAVPDRKILDKLESPVQCSAPGILIDMIDAVSKSDPNQIQTYKMCVDGKKINAGTRGQKLGDINLWGFEDHPTLLERETRLQNDIEKVTDLYSDINLLEMKAIDYLSEASEPSKEIIHSKLKCSMSVIHDRIQDIRITEVGKTIGLDKLLNQVSSENQASSDWRSSKFAYAISSVKTKIYEIDSCLCESIKILDSLGLAASLCSYSNDLYSVGNTINVGQQQNYMCLKGITTVQSLGDDFCNDKLAIVNQRSEAWHWARKQAAITGSTCYTAIGLNGLKKQQAHYNKIFCGAQPETHDAETLKRMQYGSEQEINAVATLVAKVLPVYFPHTSFYEEGCYVLPNANDTGKFVVSPDGSIRQTITVNNTTSTIPVMGVEIKCPYPGKVYSAPVHYGLPEYYIPQVLSEMVALNVSSLLYVSYSNHSSVVLIAQFDNELWTDILSVVKDLYPADDAKYPKSLHPKIKELKKALKNYSSEKVTKLCEVSSTKAIQCIHQTSSSEPGHQQHESCLRMADNDVSVTELQNTVRKSEEIVNTAWHLCRTRASEVLVFLIANLDRVHMPEIHHASPVAYAFKGYSMRSDVMRNMIECVLQECYERGIYTPVVSFDGQWFSLAIRDSSGRPLTMLQLQKDVYAEAKRKSKNDIIKSMLNANKLNASEFHDVIEKVDISYSIDDNWKINCPVEVGKLINGDVYRPSQHVVRLIRTEVQKTKGAKKQTETEADLSNESDDTVTDTVTSNVILGCLPDEVLASLDISVVNEIKRIESSMSNTSPGHNKQCLTVGGLAEFFHDAETNDTERDETPSTSAQEENGTSIENDIRIDSAKYVLSDDDYSVMLRGLSESEPDKHWKDITLPVFKSKFQTIETLSKSFNKKEIHKCLKLISSKLKEKKINHGLSWPKYKISQLFHTLQTGVGIVNNPTKQRGKMSVKSLRKLCQSALASVPKSALNAIYAEHIFPDKLAEWKRENPFIDHCDIEGIEQPIIWYSMPEYIPSRFMYQFTILDPHHLFTNARTKCCSSGIPNRGLHKEAWVRVAKGGKAGLNIALVEDLVDRQSDSFARATFSQ